MTETDENRNIILRKIDYTVPDWLLCGDLQVVWMLLDQQKGFIKLSCLIYEWNSKASLHWFKKQCSVCRPYKAYFTSTAHIVYF